MSASLRHPLRARLAAVLLGICVWLPHPATAAPGTPAPSPAPAPPRDVLRKTIAPIVDLFSRDPDGANRALSLRFRLVESTTQPAELLGSTLTFRAQAAPDNKVLFQFPALGTVVTICRQDQKVWASPASKLAPILLQAQAAKVSKADQEPLAPLRLTIPTKLFWFLFRFAGVRDAGSDPLGAIPCRQLDVDPPDGGKASNDKYMRLWVRTDSFQLARIDWKSNATDHGTLVVEDLRLATALPASDFQPDATQRADLLDVPVARFRPFMKLLGQEEEKRQKAQKAKAQGQPSAVASNG